MPCTCCRSASRRRQYRRRVAEALEQPPAQDRAHVGRERQQNLRAIGVVER